MNTTQREKTVKELLLGKTWDYLNDNFHKFKQPIKIKIALALVQKDMPQEISGISQQVILSATIQKHLPGEPENTNRIAEYFQRGSPDSSTAT